MSRRIDFVSVDAAGFNALRDEWRGAASSCALTKAGLRVATILPGYVSRQYGYAFPTDDDLAAAMTAEVTTAKRGIADLQKHGLIERTTKAKRNDTGIVTGKIRRIFLTLPDSAAPKGPAFTEGAVLAFSPKVQNTEGAVLPKVQNRVTEGADGCTNIPDIYTPDKRKPPGKKNQLGAVPERENVPSVFAGDFEFLDAFDRFLLEATDGQQIGAGEFERFVQQAFDKTTDSSDLFMPVHWRDIVALRTGDTAEWFIRRAGQLIYRSAA